MGVDVIDDVDSKIARPAGTPERVQRFLVDPERPPWIGASTRSGARQWSRAIRAACWFAGAPAAGSGLGGFGRRDRGMVSIIAFVFGFVAAGASAPRRAVDRTADDDPSSSTYLESAKFGDQSLQQVERRFA
jgi:hypothetical protein